MLKDLALVSEQRETNGKGRIGGASVRPRRWCCDMLFLFRKRPTDDELIEHARKLGVSLAEIGRADGTRSEPELQRRVLEAARARRDSWLWLLALISAIASAASAAAPWLAMGNPLPITQPSQGEEHARLYLCVRRAAPAGELERASAG